MNTESNPSKETPEFESAAERLADSMLSEHARLGSGNDDELIGNIFAKTILKSEVTPAARPAFGARNWMIMGSAVAAVIAVLLIALSNFRIDDSSRSSDTFQFVVTMANTEKPVAEATPEPKLPPKISFATPKAYEGKLEPISQKPSEIDSVEIKDRNFELVSNFDPSLSKLRARPTKIRSIRITADESSHKGSQMHYSGKVIVTHNQFTLTAEKLDVLLDKDSGLLIANGHASLELASGEIRTINPDKEELVLNGDAFTIRPLKFEIYARPLPSGK